MVIPYVDSFDDDDDDDISAPSDNHYNEFYDDYYDSEGDLVENSFDDDSDDIGKNQSKIIFELTPFELSLMLKSSFLNTQHSTLFYHFLRHKMTLFLLREFRLKIKAPLIVYSIKSN